MAVTPEDLLAPEGLVEGFMFPLDSAEQLETRLQAFIVEAIGLGSPSDAATRSWAYHRAFTAVVIRLSSLPQQVEVTDEGGHTYGPSQVANIKRLADEQLAEWEAYLAAVDELPVQTKRHGVTPNTFVW